MLFPFIRKIFKIYYFNKIVIPEFIQTYMEDKYWMWWIAIIILSLLFFYVSVRLMFTLPKVFYEKMTVKEAIIYSLDKTKNFFLVLCLAFILNYCKNQSILLSSSHSFTINPVFSG